MAVKKSIPLPKEQLKVLLLRHTPDPLATVALAARLCYSDATVEALARLKNAEKHAALVNNVVARGHESVLEHVSFTFGVSGFSRAASHQLVRHRLASYSQQSQRYVRFNKLLGVLPPSIAENPQATQVFSQAWQAVQEAYSQMVQLGIPAEDARYILPNACSTQLLITMNVRELRHFFLMRLCNRAQWEIRALATEMLRLSREVEPRLFVDCGPPCLTGTCKEGASSCGKPWQRGKPNQ